MDNAVVLVKKGQRKIAPEHSDEKEGRLIETLLVNRGNMEVYHGVIAPGGKSHGAAQHQGEEFAFILEGHLRYNVGDGIFDLGPGDLLYYPSSIPHSYLNISGKKVRVLWGEANQQQG